MKSKVLITGGSGLIGSRLTQKLIANNYDVVHLTRSKNSKHDIKTYEWNWGKKEIDENCLENINIIVHLAGAGIAEKPWTQKRKGTIVKSRVLTTRLLREVINKHKIKLNSFISASGIGVYGAITNEKVYREDDEAYNDFIGNCCKQWEKAADLFQDDTNVYKLRLGIVLDRNEGALPKMSSMIRKGLGSPLGPGNQYMPWVHIDDAVNAFMNTIENKINPGTYNVVSSQHCNNKEFTTAIGNALNRRIRLPNVPSFVIKFIYGELADILLEGSRVSNEKIKSQGFDFKYDLIEDALSEIYS